MVHYRTELRAILEDALPILFDLVGAPVTMRSVLSPRLSVDALPEFCVQVTRERPRREAASGSFGAYRRAIEITLIVRRRGANVVDRLDADSAILEHGALNILRPICDAAEITIFETAFDIEGAVPVGQLMLGIEAVVLNRAGNEEFTELS